VGWLKNTTKKEDQPIAQNKNQGHNQGKIDRKRKGKGRENSEKQEKRGTAGIVKDRRKENGEARASALYSSGD